MKRLLDLVLCILLLVVMALPMIVIALAVKLTSTGPVLHWSDRVGRANRNFRMPKFRSMRTDAPQIPTHLLRNPGTWLTPIGSFLRRTSLDELPQLFSVLAGQLSLVGPRAALFNEHDLIALRTRSRIHELTPGITGWAQVNGRTQISLSEKVRLDNEYLRSRSLWFDLRILTLTVAKVARREGISH
jgi:O-antigen biosynthesis protein WbqP